MTDEPASDVGKSQQTDRETCYFCDEKAQETHHIVPRRHGGSDKKANLVDLCQECHNRLEYLYTKRFYNALYRNWSEAIYVHDVDKDIREHDLADDIEHTTELEDPENRDTILRVIRQLNRASGSMATVDQIKDRCGRRDVPRSIVESELEVLLTRGDLHEPRDGVYSVTREADLG